MVQHDIIDVLSRDDIDFFHSIPYTMGKAAQIAQAAFL